MEYVRLGNTGLQVSELCLGCMSFGTPDWRRWVLDEEASGPFFRQAVEAGINSQVEALSQPDPVHPCR